MRNRLLGASLAAIVAVACCGVMLGQTARPQGGAKVQTASPTELTGVWRRSRRPPDNARQYTLRDLVILLGDGTSPPMTPWGEAQFKAAKPNGGPSGASLAETNDPVLKCFPPGVPRIYTSVLGSPFEIIQVPGRVIMFFEYDHFVRQIFTDGRQHPADLNPTWMGDAIGRWEGNTLVVDTVGFNDKTWLDTLGHPHSEALHVVERIRRVSQDTMTDEITMDDPKAYTKPWVVQMIFESKPDWNIAEYVCADYLTFQDLQSISESAK
jgi:hypothetical protein